MIDLPNSEVLPMVSEDDASHLHTDGANFVAVQSPPVPPEAGASDTESNGHSPNALIGNDLQRQKEVVLQAVHEAPENRREKPHGNANNRHRTLHGVKGWLAIGSYPKGCSHVRRIIGGLRIELETAVCALNGEVAKYQAALIQSACRHEGRALLLTRWLRTEAELSLSDRLAVLKEIGNATDSRDRCLKGAGLDKASAGPANPWDVLRMQQAAATGPERDGAA